MKPFNPPGVRMVLKRSRASGEQLVDVSLVADVEKKLSCGVSKT